MRHVSACVRAAMVWVVASGVAGCSWDLPPVDWQAPSPLAATADSSVQYRARWQPGASPDVTVTPVGVADPAAAVVTSGLEAAACPGGGATSPLVRGSSWSAQWQVRRDSSAVLVAVQRDSAATLVQRIIVDSVDKAPFGCARPAPSIAVDSVNGYVHVAYYMVAPEGPGLFYAHLMNIKLRQFEPPTAIVYGEKPVRASIASHADTVAVVYEDPNSERGRIAMSLSLTGGHLFDQTARLIPVSTSSQDASSPQVVRLAGGQLWVGWMEASPSGRAFLLRRAHIVQR